MTKRTNKGARPRRPAPASRVFERLPRDAEDEEIRAAVEATENLSRAMEHAGVTRAELARRLGVGRPTVTRLLQGEEGITIQRLARVAHALGMSLHVSFQTPAARTPRVSGPG